MQHEPRAFGQSRRVTWLERARAERQRQARHAAGFGGFFALVFAVGVAVAMHYGNAGGAAVFAIAAACALCLGVAAASEA